LSTNQATAARILARVNAYEPLTERDDPALANFGRAVIQLLKTKDLEAFGTAAVVNIDDMLKKFESLPEGQRPTRAQLESSWKRFFDATFAPAAAEFLSFADQAGIDLSDADVNIRSIVTSPPNSLQRRGTVEGLMAEHVRVTVDVASTRKATSGESLSGEYIIAAQQVDRTGEAWKIQKGIRWQKVPDAVLNAEQLATLRLENYVAEHGSLPPGTDAPEIEFVRITDESKFRLSDFRGKVVVLEFWATWCGPCQTPMAKMQTYPAEHPEWKDKVELIALSIDDRMTTAREHLAKNGWTNTFNAWAPGAWQSAHAKSFRVASIPKLYVIGADGKIVQSGHPEAVRISEIIKSQLR
jgi:thiol-disulfide isomerase/thioredoxin